MAQTMARIKDNIVIGLEWWDDYALETEDLKYTHEASVAMGDTYKDGLFYRDGKVVLTPLEEVSKMAEEFNEGLEEVGKVLNAQFSENPNYTHTQKIDDIVNCAVDASNAMAVLGLTNAEEEKV